MKSRVARDQPDCRLRAERLSHPQLDRLPEPAELKSIDFRLRGNHRHEPLARADIQEPQPHQRDARLRIGQLKAFIQRVARLGI